MAQCAVCRYTLQDEALYCPICSALIDTHKATPMDEAIRWTVVREVGNEVDARLIAGRLRADGIPAVVLSQVDSTRNFTVGALAVAKVFVPLELVDEARMLLELPAPPIPPFEDDQGMPTDTDLPSYD